MSGMEGKRGEWRRKGRKPKVGWDAGGKVSSVTNRSANTTSPLLTHARETFKTTPSSRKIQDAISPITGLPLMTAGYMLAKCCRIKCSP